MTDTEEDKKVLHRLAEGSLREQRARRRWSVFFRILFFGYVFGVTALWYFDEPELFAYDKPHVAVVDIVGIIEAGAGANASSVNFALREAFANESAKGVILRINSPGGSPVESNRIYRELRRLRELYPDKKVYAVAGDFCASGGYYIAVGADEIYVDENSIVGSVGAVLASFGFVEAMKEFGVERRVLAAGDEKESLDPFSPRNAKSEGRITDILESVHQTFIAAVKEGRGGRLSEVPGVLSGAVFSGTRGVEIGLADGVGDAGYVAREIIGVDELVLYHGDGWLDSVINRLGTKASALFTRSSLY